MPRPAARDPRAWDALLRVEGRRWGVEAETRIGDVQACLRSLQVKRRDGGVDGLILLLRDSRHHRQLVRVHLPLLRESFPTPAFAAIAALRSGREPEGDAMLML